MQDKDLLFLVKIASLLLELFTFIKEYKPLCRISILLTFYRELNIENRSTSLFLPVIAFEIIPVLKLGQNSIQ